MLSLRAAMFFLVLFSMHGKAASVSEVLEQGRQLRVDLVDAQWKSGQVVCVVREQKKIACGLLVSRSGNSAVVNLDFRNQVPTVGDSVLSASDVKKIESSGRSPASVALPQGEGIRYLSGGREAWMVSTNAVWDLDVISVGANVEVFIEPRATLSLRVAQYDTLNREPETRGFGFLVSRTFRALRSYRGVFASLGAGAYLLNINDVSALSFTAQASCGWTVVLSSWLRGSMEVGISYITRPQAASALAEFHQLRPWFGISLGVPF